MSSSSVFLPRLPAGDAAVQVIGVLLNHQSAWDAYAPQMQTDPHKAAPKAPVLYLKPANTWAPSGSGLEVPPEADSVVLGATLGVVIGRRASGVSPGEAMEFVAGYTLVIDASLEQPSLYRPPLKYNCRDGYCLMGPQIVPRDQVPDISAVTLHTYVDDHLVHTTPMNHLVRTLPRLIADISDFMSFSVGDVLLLGVAAAPPKLKPGQKARIEAPGTPLGSLLTYARAQVIA